MRNSQNYINSRLVLGTAQLGMKYGIANKTGQPDFEKAKFIIQEAWESGVRQFDTAQTYGVSEEILGRILTEMGVTKEAQIISKLDPAIDHLNKDAMFQAMKRSLRHFNVMGLHCIMLHKEDHLDLLEKGLGDILLSFVKLGFVKYVGVSVYSPRRAIQALSNDVFNAVQLPSNILDRRFADAGVFECAKEHGKKVYIRSIFLQGLLLIDPEDIPEKMSFVKPVLTKAIKMFRDYGVTPQQATLGYMRIKYPNAYIIFGADTFEQVRDNSIAWNADLSPSFIKLIDDAFSCVDEAIINPMRWPI